VTLVRGWDTRDYQFHGWAVTLDVLMEAFKAGKKWLDNPKIGDIAQCTRAQFVGMILLGDTDGSKGLNGVSPGTAKHSLSCHVKNWLCPRWGRGLRDISRPA